MEIEIVRATPEDAHDIAQVHVLAWRAAYEGIVPAEHLAAQSVAKREAVWRESIAKGTPEILVAKAEAQLVGWIAFGPSRDEDTASQAAEVWAMYVAPSHWSRGVGRLLWFHVRARLAEHSYKSVSVWVLAENTRAIKVLSRRRVYGRSVGSKRGHYGGQVVAGAALYICT